MRGLAMAFVAFFALLRPLAARKADVFFIQGANYATRLETDFHLAQGIPALSPPTGRTNLDDYGVQSFDMNSADYMANTWPRSTGELGNRFLHSDIKNVAYFFVHPVFRKIVEVGGLNQ